MQGGRKNRVGHMNDDASESGFSPAEAPGAGGSGPTSPGPGGGESFVAIHGLSFGGTQQSQQSHYTQQQQQQQQQVPSVMMVRGPHSKLSVFDVESGASGSNPPREQLPHRTLADTSRDGGGGGERPDERLQKRKHRARGRRENEPQAESTRIEVQTLDPPVPVVPAANSTTRAPRVSDRVPRAAVSTSVPIEEPPMAQSSWQSNPSNRTSLEESARYSGSQSASSSAALDSSATHQHSQHSPPAGPNAYGWGTQNPAFARQEERLEMESVESSDDDEGIENGGAGAGAGAGREHDSGMSQSRARSAGTASENSELREVPLVALYTNQPLYFTSTPAKEASGSSRGGHATQIEIQPVAAAAIDSTNTPPVQNLRQSGSVSRADQSRFHRL